MDIQVKSEQRPREGSELKPRRARRPAGENSGRNACTSLVSRSQKPRWSNLGDLPIDPCSAWTPCKGVKILSKIGVYCPRRSQITQCPVLRLIASYLQQVMNLLIKQPANTMAKPKLSECTHDARANKETLAARATMPAQIVSSLVMRCNLRNTSSKNPALSACTDKSQT